LHVKEKLVWSRGLLLNWRENRDWDPVATASGSKLGKEIFMSEGEAPAETASGRTPSPLEARAAEDPDKVCVIGLERSLTYSQLLVRARSLAGSFYRLGLRPGDRAGLMTYNLPEYTEISTAFGMIGVGIAMIGYRMKPPEIEHIVSDSDSKMVIFHTDFAERILPYRKQYKRLLPRGFVSFGGPAIDGAESFEELVEEPSDVDLDTIATATEPAGSMIYTSGTTGKPKGVIRGTGKGAPQEGAAEYLYHIVSFLKFASDEVHIVCCPIYHSAPSFFNMVTAMMGGTRIYQPRFDPEQFLELVDRYGATSTHLVPTMLIRLLEVPESFTGKLNLTSLRTVICGAAPLFPEHKLAFLDRFGPILYEYYGATETGVNTLIGPQEMRQRPASVGKTLTSNEMVIIDETGNSVPDGERGILYVHNPILMEGYYKNETATKETMHGKYMTVGDVAIRDEEGYYYIVDRVKDMIIRGGVNIYPAEIEKVLAAMEGIRDAAVVGRPDRELGETVAAFIVPEKDGDVTEESIQEYCDRQMANYKIPETILFLDEIPRTATGKILKRDLRDRLEGT